MITGKEIRLALMARDLTQKWLCEQLNRRGVGCTKSEMSMVLHDRRTGAKAQRVLAVSGEILNELE